jgi:hypothetical protein
MAGYFLNNKHSDSHDRDSMLRRQWSQKDDWGYYAIRNFLVVSGFRTNSRADATKEFWPRRRVFPSGFLSFFGLDCLSLMRITSPLSLLIPRTAKDEGVRVGLISLVGLSSSFAFSLSRLLILWLFLPSVGFSSPLALLHSANCQRMRECEWGSFLL